MRNEPVVAPSAYKHGVDADDTLHAFSNPLFVHRDDEGFTMIVGPAIDASLLEVGYIVSSDATPVIIHSMRPARPKFMR